MSDVVRWGLLSTADINSRLLPWFQVSPRCTVHAVASRDPSRARTYAREHGISQAYGSYGELIDDPDVECVYVNLPNALHARWTTAALEAGKHVLCEKPLAMSAQEGALLFQQADAAGRLLMEAFMFRHHGQTVALAEAIQAGQIGTPRFVQSSFHFVVEDPAEDIRLRPDLGGGAMRDLGCYCLHFAIAVAGVRLGSCTAVARTAPSGVDQGVCAIFDGYSEPLVTLDVSLDTRFTSRVTVLGSDGSITVPNPWFPGLDPAALPKGIAGPATVATDSGLSHMAFSDEGNPYLLEIENMSDAIRGKATPVVTPDQTLDTLEGIEQVLLASGLEAEPPSYVAAE